MDDRTVVSPNRAQGQQFSPLATQGSLYNLNLDEVRSQLGTVECLLLQNPSSSSSSRPFFLGNLNSNGILSKKTVDEVWREIARQEPADGHGNGVEDRSVQHLGETTLDDFLVRAGVINTGNQTTILDPQQLMAVEPMVVMSPQAGWLQLQMPVVEQRQMMVQDSSFHVSDSVYENPVVDCGESENQMGMAMPLQGMSGTPSESHQGAGSERKRGYSDEMMERTIERRQKRMIKNRESAARSRARKQAYTSQLEHEVFHLRKTNSWLKKQKEVEMMLSVDIPGSKYQLRRTSSALF